MHLTSDEVKRFYGIWFPLLYYVNQQRQLVPSFPKEWENASVHPADALSLRNALWADDSLRTAFLRENPASLSPSDIALVESWQYRVAGDFFIFRYLKKHTIFLSGVSPARAYGVLGLTGPIEEILGPSLPIYVKAVLLPFEGRIIYDSLLSSYPIVFGGGIRRSLTETYRNVEEREGIVTTLLPDSEDTSPENMRKGIRERNKKILRAFQKDLGRAGLSPKAIEQHVENIEHFSQEFLLLQSPPRGLLDIGPADVKAYLHAHTGQVNLVSFKRFARFLRDTGRADYDEAEDLLDFLMRGK